MEVATTGDCNGSLGDLLAILDERGFIVQEGQLSYVDIL
ncbi:MAG: hypothetical protein BWY85_00423 [Firmicutes bacterium ADurb.Bin506]|jgi:hypothetical protein|nr:MAG: hypothetical protein BWY85_00423 [Firmicutes bacterium ADurb.Bin506]